jgi:hypothetical protein
MAFSKYFLLFCILLLFFSASVAFSQSSQSVRIRGFYSNDSLKVRAYQNPISPSSIGTGSVGIIQENDTEFGAPIRPPVKPPEPSKCQWLRFNFSNTCWNWYIRKPGTYGGEVLDGSIQSNGRVLVEFLCFNKLQCTHGSSERLETYYAVSPPGSNINDQNWMDANNFNGYCLHFDPPPLNPVLWTLWQKVKVKTSTSAAEFRDNGTICIQLLNNHIWIDGIKADQYQTDQ